MTATWSEVAEGRVAAYRRQLYNTVVDRIAEAAVEGDARPAIREGAIAFGRLRAAGPAVAGYVGHEARQTLLTGAGYAGIPSTDALPIVDDGLQEGELAGPPDDLPNFEAPESSIPAGPAPAGGAQLDGVPLTSSSPLPELSRGLVLMCLKQEEAGDAQLFAAIYRDRLLFDRAAGAWYEFQGHAWRRLGGPPRPKVWGTAASAYLALAAQLQADQEKADEDEQKKLATQVSLLIGRAKQLRNLKRCNNVLTLAGDDGLLGITGSEWDADPWLLAVANGVIDLRTGKLRDGRPGDFIKTQAPTSWAGLNAPALRWARFVSEVMSDEADRVEFLQRALGYALNGTTREHILVLLVGERGRNGKGALFETLSKVLGSYAAAVNNDVIVGQTFRRTAGSAQPHLVSLRGKRLAYTSETAKDDEMSAAQVKLITGGDAIRARDLFEKDVTFNPSHTLFVATNRRPHAPADDDALWERVKVLEFKARFVEDPQPGEFLADLTLKDTLAGEASGILAWLVRGHLIWQCDGLRTPASVKLARDTYRKGESVEPFLEACCVEDEQGSAEGGELYAAYEVWCAREGMRPKSVKWLGEQLRQRFEKSRTATGRSCYYGLTVVRTAEDLRASASTLQQGIRTPQNGNSEGAFTRFSEGLRPISERMPHASIPHGELLNMPSDPSDPSDTCLETPLSDAPAPRSEGYVRPVRKPVSLNGTPSAIELDAARAAQALGGELGRNRPAARLPHR